MLKFSLCIPNYNYSYFIGQTIQSVSEQTFDNFEILVADNASTDNSLEILAEVANQEPRLKYKVNHCNVGFAGNLAKASEMASGDWMTLLSSDDLMLPDALQTYSKVINYFEQDDSLILSSATHVIDSDSHVTGYRTLDWRFWQGAEKHDYLTQELGADVWVSSAGKLLRNSLLFMRSPFYFVTTTYSKRVFNQVEGYSQGGLINPDKSFAWAILACSTKAVFIDKPLFSYRVHSNNQQAQQQKMGVLKHTTDQYILTFNTPTWVLEKAQITRQDLVNAFIDQDIALRGLKALADGNPLLAKRLLHYGAAAYPDVMRHNKKVLYLRGLLRLGHIGQLIARYLKNKSIEKWKKGEPIRILDFNAQKLIS